MRWDQDLQRKEDEEDEGQECPGSARALLKRYRRATQRQLDSLLDASGRDGRILARHERSPEACSVHQVESEAVFKAVGEFSRQHGGGTGAALVSLSGGVDSMVLCQVLCYMRDRSARNDAALVSQQQKHRQDGAPPGSPTRSRSPPRLQPRFAGQGRGDSGSDRSVGLGGVEGLGGGWCSHEPFVPAVAAVHVDYGNREESSREAAFLEAWCSARGILWFSICADVQRDGELEREVYEAATRDQRFALYSKALQQTGARGVMLGHHKGDVQENVISNTMKGVSLLSLGGMHPVQHMAQYGVDVFRPLLALDKADILSFAHRFGVPYFKDSTPRWSTRGKLRRQLVPLLQDMYGDGVLAKLSGLASEADEVRALLQGSLLNPFFEEVLSGAGGACITRRQFAHYLRRDLPFVFWKMVLQRTCLSVGAHVPRPGAIEQLLDRQRKELNLPRLLHRPVRTKAPATKSAEVFAGKTAGADGSLRPYAAAEGRSVSGGERACVEQDQESDVGGDLDGRAMWWQARDSTQMLLLRGCLFVLRPAVFPVPGLGNDRCWQRGQRVAVGKTYIFGPWNVTLALLSVAESGDDAAISASKPPAGDAAMTMADVIRGFLEYDIPLSQDVSVGDGCECGGAGEERGGGCIALCHGASLQRRNLSETVFAIEPHAHMPVCRGVPKASTPPSLKHAVLQSGGCCRRRVDSRTRLTQSTFDFVRVQLGSVAPRLASALIFSPYFRSPY